MSIRPETEALLDRMFGDERLADDQLTRVENVLNEFYHAVDHLAQHMKATHEALDALPIEALSVEQWDMVARLEREAQWGHDQSEEWWRQSQTALDETSDIIERLGAGA